jgi:NAD(P)-dependent dehydrogenase (short-subunit alcohol dehydrogenase family)
MDLHLEDRVVLITGGSDGLGAALVRQLRSEGALVAFCGRNEERIAALAAEVAGPDGGHGVIGMRADVTSKDDIAAFVDAAVQRWGRIDGLVSNAGQSSALPFDQHTEQTWDADIDLKLRAQITLTRLALPHLRASGGGSIINVLAIAGKAPGASSSPSSVTRAAGLALSKTLSKELGPDNIRVNSILIGLVESGQWTRRSAATGTPLDEMYKNMGANANIPLGRVGRAEEFADLAAFLLSDRAAFISGVGINFDGGASPAH